MIETWQKIKAEDGFKLKWPENEGLIYITNHTRITTISSVEPSTMHNEDCFVQWTRFDRRDCGTNMVTHFNHWPCNHIITQLHLGEPHMTKSKKATA